MWGILTAKGSEKASKKSVSHSHRYSILSWVHLKPDSKRTAGSQNGISDKTLSNKTVVWLSSKRLLELIHQKINKHKRPYHTGAADVTEKKGEKNYTSDKMGDKSR